MEQYNVYNFEVCEDGDPTSFIRNISKGLLQFTMQNGEVFTRMK